MKQQLIFDATELASSDSVGAYLRASDGTLLTHTDVGGKKALDVRVAEGINVEVDLSHTDDSVRLGDGTNFFTSTSENSDVALDVHISNTSIEVTATDLDIRDLTFATDSVDASGSTLGANDGVDIGDVTVNNAGGASAVNIQDGGNSITVDAVDLDIRDLDAATDSVESHTHDGSGTAITSRAEDGGQALDVHVTGSGPLTVNDSALANTAIATAAETLDVANTAQNIVVSPLADRKYVYIHNEDNRDMEIGPSGFSVGNGFPIFPGTTIELRAGAAVDVEFNSTKVNHKIRTMELS